MYSATKCVWHALSATLILSLAFVLPNHSYNKCAEKNSLRHRRLFCIKYQLYIVLFFNNHKCILSYTYLGLICIYYFNCYIPAWARFGCGAALLLWLYYYAHYRWAGDAPGVSRHSRPWGWLPEIILQNHILINTALIFLFRQPKSVELLSR